MRTKGFWISLAVLVLCVSYAGKSSTINGIANQIISSYTAHGILLGEGTGDIAAVAPGTAGLPFVSGGSSADGSFAALANAALTNSSLTITGSGCITGGGAVSLGASVTLTNTCQGNSGVTNAAPGATPTWTLANGDISWTLSANATAIVTVAGGDQWRKVNAHICQPASGGPYTLTWPSNVKGGFVVSPTASKCSDQPFDSPDGTNLYASGTGVIGQ